MKNLEGMTRFVASLEGNGLFIFMAIMSCLCVVFMVTPMFIKSSEQKQSTEGQGGEASGASSKSASSDADGQDT